MKLVPERAQQILLKMFEAEFEDIKEVIKDFRIAKMMFKRPQTNSYVTPGMKSRDSDNFSKLMSFLMANQSGGRVCTPQAFGFYSSGMSSQMDEKSNLNKTHSSHDIEKEGQIVSMNSMDG